MKKRKLQLEELRVESAEMTVSGAPEGTVHGAQQTFVGCQVTYAYCTYPTDYCMYPTATPSCPATATEGEGYTCAHGCMVPRTDALACCTHGECTVYICGPL